MTRLNQHQRGSALLIVLGMLAFMVISAVAFSAYMRTSRLPSSYLRRTVASRMLVKSALANAIEEIDAAIGDNQHPGYGTKRYYFPRGEDQDERREINRNKWVGRVYIGSEDSGKDASNPSQSLIEQNKTVSTLSLEGLAYIPPPLVNEARYYSRHSNAAKWHTMGFDSGRYAFTAIDVSDYFDINALTADGPRNSSPSGRISLSYLFENADHSAAATTASGWDTFIGQYVNAKVPLISMADWNLAMGSQQFGGFIRSYFCQYVGGTGQDFYNGAAEGTGIDNISRMCFVTDGWFPATNAVGAAGDLTYNQPFHNIALGSTDSRQPSVRDILSGTSPMRKIIEQNLSMLDTISLFDYLDKNDVPTSLALPTLERAPMLTALQPNFKIKFLAKKSDPQNGEWQTIDDNTQEREVDFSYTLQIDPQQSMIAGLWMFPFLRDKRTGSFTAEIAVRIGFANVNANMRADRNGCGYAVADDSDFQKSGVIEGGVIKLMKSVSLNVKADIQKEEDAFEDQAVNITDFGNVAGQGKEVFHTKWKQKRTKDQDGNWVEQPEAEWESISGSVVTDGTVMYPYGTLSEINSQYNKDKILDKAVSIPVVPYMTITARVKNGNGKTIDLVPASLSDDKSYNNVQNDQNLANINGSDGEYPLMLMIDKNAKTLDFSPNGFTKEGTTIDADFKPTKNMETVYCPDPRWNFAPENFLAVNDAPANIKNYYVSNKAKAGLGVGGRDRDIFMRVSNQGWMQSASELSYITRCGDQGNMYGDVASAVWTKQTFEELSGDLNDADMTSKLRHGNVMWRTWRLYDMDGMNRDDILDLGLYNSSQGFAVSPYSDAANVFMSAFANTPTSWCMAYEDNEKMNLKDMSAKEFNNKYAYNSYNSSAKFDWSDLTNVAGRVMSAMRGADNWQEAYDNLDWGDVDQGSNYGDYFCGVKLNGDTCDLFEIDRKMMCGFWRDCFAIKQQLFLIFVRAEPLMMGGGGVHQTPPQLGGRAVALVWRDPNPSKDGNTANGAPPHRTRILFYRQFD